MTTQSRHVEELAIEIQCLARAAALCAAQRPLAARVALVLAVGAAHEALEILAGKEQAA